MTLNSDGTHTCDRCGSDCGNGSVRTCVVVADTDPHNPGMVRNLHYCRDREVDGDKIRGCEHRLLNAGMMTHYNDTRPEPQEASDDQPEPDDQP